MSFMEGNLHLKVEKLEAANGRLCEQINGQQETIDELAELVLDLWPRAAFTMTGENRASYAERMAALGLEVGE